MTFEPVEPRVVGRLASAPLKLAIVQARTTPVLALEQAPEVQRLLARLGEQWTLTDRQINRELSVQLGPAGFQQQAAAPETVWILTAPDGRTRAVVSSRSVAAECDRYTEWSEFRTTIREVFEAVEETFAPARCDRFGVRYVNELQDDRLSSNANQITEILNVALMAPALALRRPVVGSLAELRTAEDDNIFALRHGLTQIGTYLLDFDAYREIPQPFTTGELTDLADRFHALIESVFAWSLTEAYLEELRVNAEDASE